MEEQQAKEQEVANKQLQQLTTHNAALAELIKTQQKKIYEFLDSSNNMIEALQLQMSAPKKQAAMPYSNKGTCVCKHCKKLTTHQDDNCYHLETNKDKRL